MRWIIFILGISTSSFTFGQVSHSDTNKHFPKHYLSVNALNLILANQIGITYEYKSGLIGIDVSSGYIYPSGSELSRFLIATTTNYGAFENYSGFFAIPQINLYFSKPHNFNNATICYLSLKGVYRNMHIDSNKLYIWNHNTNGDDSWIYRRQVDKVNIKGAFVLFGLKYIYKHFFVDFNIGPGWLSIDQKMIVAQEQTTHGWPTYANYPFKDKLNRHNYTINISLNFGRAF